VAHTVPLMCLPVRGLALAVAIECGKAMAVHLAAFGIAVIALVGRERRHRLLIVGGFGLRRFGFGDFYHPYDLFLIDCRGSIYGVILSTPMIYFGLIFEIPFMV
jgi:hypothetical protein